MMPVYEMIALISTISTGLTIFTTSLLWSLRRSRCVNLECQLCGSKCIKCERSLMDIEEQLNDTLTHATMGTSIIDEDDTSYKYRSRRNSII